jgi:cell division septal protein FtsQ
MKKVFNQIRNLFLLPSTVIMILFVGAYSFLEFFTDWFSADKFLFWDVEIGGDSEKAVDKILESIKPYEYAFSTIFWILFISWIL